jgi:hypothetical protein
LVNCRTCRATDGACYAITEGQQFQEAPEVYSIDLDTGEATFLFEFKELVNESSFIGADDIVFDSAGDAYVTIDASKLDDDSWWTELHALDLESGELTYLARVSYGYNDGGQSYWETVTPVASRVEGGL